MQEAANNVRILVAVGVLAHKTGDGLMFVLGLVLGGWIGAMAMAVLVVASDADDGMGIE